MWVRSHQFSRTSSIRISIGVQFWHQNFRIRSLSQTKCCLPFFNTRKQKVQHFCGKCGAFVGAICFLLLSYSLMFVWLSSCPEGSHEVREHQLLHYINCKSLWRAVQNCRLLAGTYEPGSTAWAVRVMVSQWWRTMWCSTLFSQLFQTHNDYSCISIIQNMPILNWILTTFIFTRGIHCVFKSIFIFSLIDYPLLSI